MSPLKKFKSTTETENKNDLETPSANSDEVNKSTNGNDVIQISSNKRDQKLKSKIQMKKKIVISNLNISDINNVSNNIIAPSSHSAYSHCQTDFDKPSVPLNKS